MVKDPRALPLARLGSNVRKQRDKLRLTQERVGELAELDPTYISGIERGIRNPSILSIVRIAVALQTTAADLCSGIEAIKP